MAYCYECGSQVAEIDVFCPYCGISLNPAGVGDDVSMDKTIVISNGESSASSEVSGVAETEKPSEISAEQTEIADDKAVTLTDEHKSVESISNLTTEQTYSMKTEDVELSPEIFENISDKAVETPIAEQKSEQIEAETTVDEKTLAEETEVVDDVKETEQPAAQINDFDLPEPKHIEILKPIAEVSEPINEEPSENQIAETPVFSVETESSEIISETENEVVPEIKNESFESSADEDLITQFDNPLADEEPKSEPQIEVNSEIEAEIPISEPIENIEVSEAANEETSQTESEKIGDEPDQDLVRTMIHPSQNLEQDKIFNDAINKIDEGKIEESKNLEPQPAENIEMEMPPIFKPEQELEEIKSPESAAVFDSVQIVQPDQREAGFEEKVAAIEAEKISSGQISESSEAKESRPYTTPNIGAGQTDGKKAAKLKPLEEGTILNNRYEIIRKIGGGGMGAVYLASDKNLGGVLRAVKEMVQSYIEEIQQDKAISDFKRESMLLTSLEHAAIPTIYDYFFEEKEARFYLVMKYISGGDLAGRLRASAEGKLDEKTVTEWGIQIADVLDYLHKHEPPIVYRDLKPANVMIDGNSGRLMLIDFGIARWINKEEKGVTAVGTMGYAPPELFSGNVEPRSDIYSLGSTMFHLLTGADPQNNPLLIFDFQKNPRPRQINPSLSDQMENLLMQSVEYNAEKRFESAAALKKSLEEHLENLKAGRVSYGVKATPVSQTLSEQLVFCGFCGQKIIASDMFCAFCGSKQPLAQQGVQPSPYVGQSVTARLVLENTEEFEKPMFSLEKENNIVGRRDPMSNIFPEVDLSKFDPQTKISRRHARIWREGNNYLVEDLGSSNGTVLIPSLSDLVRLLPHQPHILTNGDKIKVGDTTMSFTIG